METSASEIINASREQVWDIVSDFEKAKDRISCIKDIEVLNKPENGIVGYRWKETREMFGKEAIETMWITEAQENEYYIAEAINSGCVYQSTVRLKEVDGKTLLEMSFKSTAQSFFAKLMSPLMFMMKGMIKKAFIKDIQDIKSFLERT